MTDNNTRGRKKVNRNRLTLDFKCSNCDYTMKESHNILEIQVLSVLTIIQEWTQVLESHLIDCVESAIVITESDNLSIAESDMIPIAIQGITE